MNEWPLRVAVTALSALVSLGTAAALAEELPFSTSQYGRVNLSASQSAFGRNLESALHGNPVFEPLKDYPPGDRLRDLAGPVGRLDILHERGLNTCTASVISAEHLLTNWHCVPGEPSTLAMAGRIVTVSFLSDFYDTTDEGSTRRYQVDPQPLESSQTLDYAILRVFGNPAERTGVLRLTARDASPGESLLVIHHPGGKPKHVTRGRCRAASPRAVSGDTLFHTCDTLVGSSGAPIISDGESIAVGLHFAGLDIGSGANVNHGKRLARLVEASPILRSLAGQAGQVAVVPPPPPPRRPLVQEIVGVFPQPRSVFRDLRLDGSDCPECPEMVVVPSGSFTMGASTAEHEREGLPAEFRPREQPEHLVRIGYSFAVGRYEVTRGEFGRFVRESNYSVGKGCWKWTGKWEKDDAADWRSPGYAQTDEHPVVCVSWDDAKAYAGWLSRKTGKSYRLLSEAEWEYAARAGTTTARYWGQSADQGCGYANGADLTLRDTLNWSGVANCRDEHVYTASVGRFRANRFGLNDMLGNVWEWVEDCWNGSYSGAPSDGRAWTTGDCSPRVLRGGSWFSYPWFVRSAIRLWFSADFRNYYFGFRLARTLNP